MKGDNSDGVSSNGRRPELVETSLSWLRQHATLIKLAIIKVANLSRNHNWDRIVVKPRFRIGQLAY